jgi:alpha-L-fucosidase
MAVNSESIYGTTASPIGAVPWGRCTAKPGKLYLHVFNWPADGNLHVPAVKGEVKKAYLLAESKHTKLTVRSDVEGGVIIALTKHAPDPVDSVVVLEIK